MKHRWIASLSGLALAGVLLTTFAVVSNAQVAGPGQPGGGFGGGQPGQPGGRGGAGGGFGGGQPGQPGGFGGPAGQPGGFGGQGGMMGGGGGAAMVVDGNTLYILQGNRLLKVNKNSFAVEKEATLPRPQGQLGRPGAQGGGAPPPNPGDGGGEESTK